MISSTGAQMRKGFAWSFIENISLQVTRFIVGVIMARILTPADYGLIGMLTVFLVISDLFVNSGIGAALNQKRDRSDVDFSTAFIFNVSVGVLCYCVLFLCAKFIAQFYNEPRLLELLRWLSIVIVIKSLCVVPNILLQINLRFKAISIISLATSIVLGISGIVLAYMGYGVWALVYSNIIGTLFTLICYEWVTGWIPKTKFSVVSFRKLFGYGSRLLLATFIEVVYNNIYPLVIGKVYSATQLGYYSRAQGYSTLPTGTLSSMIYRVCFPVFCKQKDNMSSLLENYNHIIRATAYIIIPIMILLLVISKQLVLILLTEKWLPCVIYLQILCLSTLWFPIMEVNTSVIKALGHSNAILKMQLISKAFALVVLLFTAQYRVEIMCIGAVIVSIFSLILNFIISRRFIMQGAMQQFKMISVPIIGGCCMLPTLWIMTFYGNVYVQLFIGLVVSLSIYFAITTMLGLSPKRIFYEIKNI